MSRFPYKPGDALAICDRCGFQYYHSQLELEWTGLLVCRVCYDERHPQEVGPASGRVSEGRPVPDARPVVTEVFLSAGDVTPDDL